MERELLSKIQIGKMDGSPVVMLSHTGARFGGASRRYHTLEAVGLARSGDLNGWSERIASTPRGFSGPWESD